jgi:hypothetical protein
VFKVLDTAGNGLPGLNVLLHPTTLAGGLTLDGSQSDVTKLSDSNGQVSVLINSGTVPTPVRITASLVSQPSVTTVSSSLSIAVGLPSQLNFSLSQATPNIEGGNYDGTLNTYSIIASDRLGNPVPAGTSINFISEGGQIVQSALTTIDANGNARASATFLSSEPRPADGRITVLAYALGEESFIDLNGNNLFDPTEPFQDLGNIYLDRYYNNFYNSNDDQFISTTISSSSSCQAIDPGYASLLGLTPSIPSIPNTCDTVWGKAYVRRAIETVFSTSGANPHWASGFDNLGTVNGAACPIDLLTVSVASNESPNQLPFYPLLGTAIYGAGTYSFLVSDANLTRLNPVPAGSTITVKGSAGVQAELLGGSPVPGTLQASNATFTVSFLSGTASGTVTITITTPKGVATSIGVNVFATTTVPLPICN